MLLLPGMDGTGNFFKAFIEQLPRDIDVKVVSYPKDVYLTYDQIAQNVRSVMPLSAPYVIIAESYSGPVASLLAASPVGNLRAVVFVSSFVSLPWGLIGTYIAKILPSVLFNLRPPAWLLRWLLMNSATPEKLISEVQATIASISAEVLASRLREALKADFSQPLRDSSVRVVCLVPESDRLLGAQCYQLLREARPDIETIKIAGPHFLLQCSPESSWAALQKTGLFESR